MSGAIRRLGTIERDLRVRLHLAIVKARGKPEGPFKDKDLVYSSHHRCRCGAGLAYPRDLPLIWREYAYWDCSDILTGRAVGPSGHSGHWPFTFYDIKSEHQPSANGATTRPKP